MEYEIAKRLESTSRSGDELSNALGCVMHVKVSRVDRRIEGITLQFLSIYQARSTTVESCYHTNAACVYQLQFQSPERLPVLALALDSYYACSWVL